MLTVQDMLVGESEGTHRIRLTLREPLLARQPALVATTVSGLIVTNSERSILQTTGC
jgi:hypothetical protein